MTVVCHVLRDVSDAAGAVEEIHSPSVSQSGSKSESLIFPRIVTDFYARHRRRRASERTLFFRHLHVGDRSVLHS